MTIRPWPTLRLLWLSFLQQILGFFDKADRRAQSVEGCFYGRDAAGYRDWIWHSASTAIPWISPRLELAGGYTRRSGQISLYVAFMSQGIAAAPCNSLKQEGNDCDTVRHGNGFQISQKPLILLAIPAGLSLCDRNQVVVQNFLQTF